MNRLNLRFLSEPSVRFLRSLFANRPQLIQESRNETAGSTHVVFSGGVFGSDLEREQAGKNSEEFVGAVDGEERGECGAECAAGLNCN